MAAKIVRQPNQIALLGAPTSAAAMSRGHERAPQALRAAGLVERLKSAGYQVSDLGDDGSYLFEPDEASPRARNLPRILQSLESLKPRVEAAVKSGALLLILAGDCTASLAMIAGMRRYYRSVSLIYMDRDAELNVPATTRTGCVDGMVVSHLTGRGAAEIVRFWSEPPLVRDPDIALFGIDRLEPREEEALRQSTLRHYTASDVKRTGAKAAAEQAIDRIHGKTSEFAVHLDVDVISDFRATDFPAEGGLSLEDVREALSSFVRNKHLAAIEIAAYNPEKDEGGSGAKTIVELLGDVLEARLKASEPQAQQSAEDETKSVPAALPPVAQPPIESGIVAGEAWSPDAIESESTAEPDQEIPPQISEGSDSHS